MALALFLIVIALLTLFSNTIQTVMLPKVTTEMPWRKNLVYSIKESGFLVPKRQIDLTSDSGWNIRKLHVKEKDRVKKGQILVTFDTSEGEEQRQDAELNVSRLELNMEVLQETYISAQHNGDDEAIRKANRDLKTGRLELEAARRKLEQLRKDIATKRTLTAPYEGQIGKIEAEEGLSAPPGQRLLTLIKSSEGFEFSFTIPAGSAERLGMNEEIPVILHGEQEKKLNGTIAEIKNAFGGNGPSGQGSGTEGNEPAPEQRTVIVTVSDLGLEGGEKVSVDIERPALEQGLVISKKWLRQDANGSYVLVILERRSALGNTYTVRKAYVVTGEEVLDEIVILRGLSEAEEVVAESSAPLQEGDRVAWNGEMDRKG